METVFKHARTTEFIVTFQLLLPLSCDSTAVKMILLVLVGVRRKYARQIRSIAVAVPVVQNLT